MYKLPHSEKGGAFLCHWSVSDMVTVKLLNGQMIDNMISTADPDFEPVWCSQCLMILSIGKRKGEEKYWCVNCGIIEMWELDKQYHSDVDKL